MNPVVPEGAKVYVTHLRLFSGSIEYMTRREAEKFGYRAPKPKGGMTLAQVELEDGRVGRGAAVCSMLDNFSRRRGRLIATGRALKQLENER